MEQTKTKFTYLFVSESLKAPLARFHHDIGRFPTNEEGLNSLIERPVGIPDAWKGPYIRELPLDAWGNSYEYSNPPKHDNVPYDLFSKGPDGIMSDDDIGNWMDKEKFIEREYRIGSWLIMIPVIVLVFGTVLWRKNRMAQQAAGGDVAR